MRMEILTENDTNGIIIPGSRSTWIKNDRKGVEPLKEDENEVQRLRKEVQELKQRERIR